MSSWAKSGVKCVCIGVDWDDLHEATVRHPVLGEALTIRDTDTDDFGRFGVSFIELGDDDFYLASRFQLEGETA